MFRPFKSVAALLAAALTAGSALAVTGCMSLGDKTLHISNGSSNGATAAPASHATNRFAGVKANTGYVTHAHVDGQHVLTLNDDFKVPDAPAPHWQVIDSSGNAYLLKRLVIKGDKFNKTQTVPAYVPDVAKVQIWCAYAEVNLGEASFPAPVK